MFVRMDMQTSSWVIKQKKHDKYGLLSTTAMTECKTRNFIGALSSVCLGPLSDIANSLNEGQFPSHWCDCVHEEDGGCDLRGERPQEGIELLREELDALTFKSGIATARDDVSGKDLVPKLVQAARDEEVGYFMKRGVYDVVPRNH